MKKLFICLAISSLLSSSCKKEESNHVDTGRPRLNPNEFNNMEVPTTRYLNYFFKEGGMVSLGAEGFQSLVLDPEFNRQMISKTSREMSNGFWIYTEFKSRMFYKGKNLAIGVPYNSEYILAESRNRLRYLDYDSNDINDPKTKLKLSHQLIVEGQNIEKSSFGHKSFFVEGQEWIPSELDADYDTGDYSIRFLGNSVTREGDTYSFDIITIRVEYMWYRFNLDVPDEISVFKCNTRTAQKSNGRLVKKGQVESIDALIELNVEQAGGLTR